MLKRLLFIAALLLALPARAALTLDTTTCASGTVTNCPHEHLSGSVAWTLGVSAPIAFTTTLSAAGAGTLLLACILDENHASPTLTGIPTLAVGTGANYSTAWTVVPSSTVSSGNGATACYYAITARSFTGETPTVTLKCSGGTATCALTGTAGYETHIIVLGWSAAFPTPGNASASNSVSYTPSVSLTTSSGDRVVMGWYDNTSANCAQTLTTNATIVDAWAPPSATVVSGCNSGADDYFVSVWTTSTTSAGTTTIGTTALPGGPASGVQYAVEICDSTATACPNGGTTQTGWWNWGAN